MKQAFTILFVALTSAAFATVRTVGNTPATIAQFNSIQAALDVSSTGDSVYVHGSPNTYAAFTITGKKITLIGPGFSPDKQLGFAAIVAGFTITGAASAETEIQGMTVTGAITISSVKPDNLRFIRNNFVNLTISITQGSTTYSGYLFESNLFENSQVNASTTSTYQNFIFQNNYFYETGCCIGGNVTGFTNTVNVLFDHNLFFGPASGSRDVFSNNCRFLTISNNIFVRRNAATNNSNSVFNNNITFNAVNNTPWLSNGNVNSGGNVENQDPQMAAQATVNAGTSNALADFTIAAGPANNTATDGKDMGLLYDVTGSLNFANGRNSRLPRIFSMNVITPTVPAGGMVTINVDARVSN